jgi:hypothetical protein
MAELTRFTLDNGGTVIVQTPSPGRVVDAGLMQKRPGDVTVPLRAALDSITDAASEVLAGFQSMFHRPDEVEIQLGVSFDASFGMVIASASSGAHLDVKLRWSGTHQPVGNEDDTP